MLLGGGQQFGPFARALFRQQRIEASNQTLAGKVRMGDLDQIRLVEEGHLQLTTGGQFLNLAGAQSRDPLDAAGGRQVLANACAGDHAAVADQHDIGKAEAFAQLFDLRGDRFGIARVALEDLHCHGTARGIREQAKNDLRFAGLIVAGVTEFGQRAVAPFEVSGGQIVKHQAAVAELALGQLLFDARLP